MRTRKFKNKVVATLVIFSLLLSLFLVANNNIQKAEASSKLGDILFLRPDFSENNLKGTDHGSKVMALAVKEYQERYGGKVKFVFADYNGWRTKLLAMAAAGTPVDVISVWETDIPSFYTRGLIQPVDNYVNLKAPYFDQNAMENFKYKGRHYAVVGKGASVPWGVIYNKDLMLEEGIDESEMPYELFKRGRWNWDTFEKLAKKLTADTNKDGKVDRYGVTFWNGMVLAYFNGTPFVGIDKNGNVKLNFDSGALQRALNFYRKGVKEGWLTTDWNIVSSGMKKRQTAMLVAPYYKFDQDRRDCDDEILFAPQPFGPDNKNKYYHFVLGIAWAIGKGCKNPAGAGKFIELMHEADQKVPQDPAPPLPKEVTEAVNVMAKKPFYFYAADSYLLTVIPRWEILGAIESADSVAAGLASLRPRAEKAIKETFYGTGTKPIIREFKPFAVNFDDGKIDKIKAYDPNKKTVKFTLVSGKEAIKGKSLKVTWDASKDGNEIYILTDPSKIKVYGWHDYKVSFDIKVMKNIKPGSTKVVCSILSEPKVGATSYGSVSKNIDRGQTVYRVEGNITNIQDNSENMCLRIGVQNGGDFIIDNIKVEELK